LWGGAARARGGRAAAPYFPPPGRAPPSLRPPRDRIPPYVVFSDATLKDMCAVLPKTREEMLTVKGVGEHKMKKYGESFLRCIEEHRSKD
uniref:HRDC domain-containing protein n=1 Tax=uncultured Mitsuokella sp. TaxID=453120 RepID=UPI002594D14B